ncbi:MAG: hypothetical protein DMG08_04470 [Acidobacteria bacterium]|nr:MAG: hypothetical protein DMG08_04470 [Acidobacteriota bacterium]
MILQISCENFGPLQIADKELYSASWRLPAQRQISITRGNGLTAKRPATNFTNWTNFSVFVQFVKFVAKL